MKIIENNTEPQIQEGISALYFTASWCGPCRSLSPIMDKISGDLPDISFYKIDVDTNKEISAKWGIRSIPTVVFTKNGQEVDKFIGLKTEASIQEIIKKFQ